MFVFMQTYIDLTLRVCHIHSDMHAKACIYISASVFLFLPLPVIVSFNGQFWESIPTPSHTNYCHLLSFPFRYSAMQERGQGIGFFRLRFKAKLVGSQIPDCTCKDELQP